MQIKQVNSTKFLWNFFLEGTHAKLIKTNSLLKLIKTKLIKTKLIKTKKMQSLLKQISFVGVLSRTKFLWNFVLEITHAKLIKTNSIYLWHCKKIKWIFKFVFTKVPNLITSLKDNKAVGHDNLTSYYLKAARYVIASYLTLFINFAFTQGIFPYNCKIARVTPKFKTEVKEETNNYRLTSILTCFSKIIEKLIYVRIMNFFKKHKVISSSQYDFQSNISTSHAMIDVITTSYENIKNDNLFTGLVFVDLKKAFDTV